MNAHSFTFQAQCVALTPLLSTEQRNQWAQTTLLTVGTFQNFSILGYAAEQLGFFSRPILKRGFIKALKKTFNSEGFKCIPREHAPQMNEDLREK